MPDFNNILYPINLDSKDNSNVKSALEFSIKSNAVIHFLYVNDPAAGYRFPTDFQDAVALKVKEFVPSDLLEKAKTVYAVSKGELGEEIKGYCKKNSIDLIITSHKHRSKVYNSLFDSPDENIIDSVNIPVLLLPRK